jgi:hypothetical protein
MKTVIRRQYTGRHCGQRGGYARQINNALFLHGMKNMPQKP